MEEVLLDMKHFQVLRLSELEEKVKWSKLWEIANPKNVFAHPEYVGLFVPEGGEGYLVVSQDNQDILCMALIANPVPPEFQNGTERYFDVSSPYGYGGPFYLSKPSTNARKNLEETLWSGIHGWAREENIVCEFIRFSLDSEFIPGYPGNVVPRALNIVRDLDGTWEEIWGDFEKKVRKDVRKSISLGVTISVDEAGEDIDDFLSIYHTTMTRREASEKYYFGRSFFETINTKLQGNFAYFHAWSKGKIVSSELVLYNENEAYSFLGGTLQEAYSLHPNHLLKSEIMTWCMDRGIQRFVLGGGASPNDGIELYKKSFTPKREQPIFHTGERIFMPDEYSSLTSRWHELNHDSAEPIPAAKGYFPLFRQALRSKA